MLAASLLLPFPQRGGPEFTRWVAVFQEEESFVQALCLNEKPAFPGEQAP